jgi:hypothetical protein
MRVNDLALDGEVLRHFEAMRDSSTDFLEEWISLEQLMHEHGLEFMDGRSAVEWYNACYDAMNVLDRLINIVAAAPEPVPLHWLRWRTETRKSLTTFLDMLDLALPQHLRP